MVDKEAVENLAVVCRSRAYYPLPCKILFSIIILFNIRYYLVLLYY